MGVNMLTKDPYAAEEMQALRYPSSPSAPQQPTLMDGVKDQLKEKGINMAMKAAEEAAVAKAGSMLGTAVGGPAGGVVGGVVAPGLYEGALKPIFQKLFFNDGGMVGGPLSSMMTNVSKVRYKQSGGKVAEEIELNYHGPLASKGV
jgi:hypothetical protein